MNYQAMVALVYEALDSENDVDAKGLFDQLYSSIENNWKKYIIRKLGTAHLESTGVDIMQEGAVAVWLNLRDKKYDPNRNNNFLRWCFVILYKKLMNYYRSKYTKKQAVGMKQEWEASIVDNAQRPDLECEQYEQAAKILLHIDNFPNLQRKIIMDKLEGISGVKTAETLGLTPVIVSRQLKAARNALAESIF